MPRTIFTSLKKDSFESCFSWVRSVKQPGLKIMVIDMGLDDAHVSKLKDLGVCVIPNSRKTGAQADVFNSFLPYADDEGVFLFWDMSVQAENISPLWETESFAAPAFDPETSMLALVFPLSVIDTRVKIGKRLEKGPRYFAGLMAGTAENWKLFTGLFNTLIETGVMEDIQNSRSLVLNLFSLYFQKVEMKMVDYKISALQPAI